MDFFVALLLAMTAAKVARISRHQRRACRRAPVALRLQQAHDLRIRPRAAEQKALPFVASFLAQAAYFGLGLDAFGRDGDAEALAETDDRTHDRLRIGV